MDNGKRFGWGYETAGGSERNNGSECELLPFPVSVVRVSVLRGGAGDVR